jgi:hypothetical protein
MTISLNVSSSVAISSYSELQDAIAQWLDRDDLDDQIPTFVLMAESFFNRELKTPEMEESYTFSTSSEDTLLPGDYLGMRAIYRETDPDFPLRGTTPDKLRQDYGGVAGTPTSYAIVGGSIRLAPVPDSTVTLTMDYFKRIENLTVTTPTNWLLQNHPDLYLFATLFFAEAYLDNATRAGQWKALAEDILGRLKVAANKVRWGAGVRPTTVAQATRGRC